MKHIPLEKLSDGMTLGRSAFDPWGGLLACAGTTVTDALVSVMKNRGALYAIVCGDDTDAGSVAHILDRLVADIAAAAGSPDTVCRVTDDVNSRLTRLLDGGVYGHLMLDEKARRDVVGIVTASAGNAAPLYDVAVPEKDGDIRDHTIMTAVLSALYARRQRYSAGVTDSIVTGALLHDCGKCVLREMGISNSSRSRHELYPEHPVFGFVLARRAGFIGDSPECEVILRHHEHPDGSGFPTGVAIDGATSASAGAARGGKSIVPLALLISVMSSYDNSVRMSSADHLAVHNACRELIFSADIRYHPDVVRALVEIMRLYPVGSTIRITDIDNPVLTGSRGIVAGVDECTGMPHIVVTSDREGLPVQPIRIDSSRLKKIGLNLEI